jgi:hypothetical protein
LYAGGIVALHGGFGPLLSLVALMREMTHGNRLSKTSSPLVTACGEESAEASAP